MNDRRFSIRGPVAFGLALVLCAAVLPPGAARAQGGFGGEDPGAAADPAVPQIEEAESAFRRGLEAFEAGDYEMAVQRFDVAAGSYPLHQTTTAAALMAAKALYRLGEYARADERLSRFLREYPSSGYVGEARRVRGYARQQLGLEGEGGERRVLDLGIALPLTDRDAALTQALFNGIQLAVAKQNGGDGAQAVRMIFRNTEADPEAARQAVAALAEEGADVVIGPLYSRTARPAGAGAEEERLPMIAPLATDRGVSQGRRYVLQANPTIAMRGRQMAVFADQSLRMERFGVVSQPEGTLSYRLAESFRAEVERRGGQIAFSDTLEGMRAWGNLNERIPADAMANVEAVYLPISGGNASRHVQAALTALDRADVPRLRVLGNGEWHDLSIEEAASHFQVTYSNAFRVDPSAPAVQAFIERYRRAYGQTPDQLSTTGRRLAYTGRDVTRFLLAARRRAATEGGEASSSPPSLPEVLRAAPRYEGLGMRIDFEDANVNEAMFFHRYRNGRLELMR
ncbi:MAG: amino acid ABC transporter substrate-binding protein [Bacteroidetes bacterium QH_2_67_10]|nr:MAG: amino acid ABC transporter substrate-binding protein [Bacteroidetes bacterium QH_2_67_10]